MERRLEGRNEFWEHLVDTGVLDEGLAEEFARACDAGWTPLGKLLVQRGHLSMKQLMGLLAMQSEEPHRRLGDLALREGYCDEEQVRGALVEQRRSCPHPIELLLADPRVDNGALLTPLVDYVRWLEGALRDVRATLPG